jgi:hypothetical protein
MLHKDGIKNLSAVYPELARVWIKTGDSRTPLKGVWIDESKLRHLQNEPCQTNGENQTAELAEDHLALAA